MGSLIRKVFGNLEHAHSQTDDDVCVYIGTGESVLQIHNSPVYIHIANLYTHTHTDRGESVSIGGLSSDSAAMAMALPQCLPACAATCRKANSEKNTSQPQQQRKRIHTHTSTQIQWYIHMYFLLFFGT